jgi:tRNA modification GTPase
VTASIGATVSVLTPPGRGAVAVVAVEGSQVIELVEQFFRPASAKRLRERRLGDIVYGRWGARLAEDVIVSCHSDRQLEVHCHGGSAAVRRIVDDLTGAGAVEESWRDWATRHEPHPILQAARVAFAGALTERAAMILLDQYHGALETSLEKIIRCLAESEIGRPRELIGQLLHRAPLGVHLTQPWRVVIAGPPNVGKSSLINAILGYERAIVFDQPGTTRDVVTAMTALDGWPVEMADTAGLSAGIDALDKAAVERATTQANAADCLLLVFDASQHWTEEQQNLIERWPTAVVVHNKCDLVASARQHAGQYISAKTGQGIGGLVDAIASRLIPSPPPPGGAVPFTQEQVQQLQAAALDLAARNIEAAKSRLLAMLA